MIQRKPARFNPLLAMLRSAWFEATGRIHFPSTPEGTTVTIDGEQWMVFRKVRLDVPGAPDPEAELCSRFQASKKLSAWERFVLLILPIPLLCGVRGFRGKTWLRNQNGEYMGISHWQTVEHAERYLESGAVQWIDRRCTPGSLRVQVLASIGIA